MQISIVSGKGGAGKTTLATHFFMAVPESALLDCDVEEPNASLFLNLGNTRDEEFETRYPVVDDEACTHCGACAAFCAFNALLVSPAAAIPLPERCHDCGGCALVCPENAIHYESRSIGRIRRGHAGDGRVAWGELNVGELSGVRMIRRLRQSASDDGVTWIDGPPGTGCAAVAAVEDADFAVLVGEPTPFGVSDMAMAADMIRDLGLPFGVVVNKAGIGNDEIYRYCRNEGLTILGEIPFDRGLAEAGAIGRLGWGHAGCTERFTDLARRIVAAAEAAE